MIEKIKPLAKPSGFKFTKKKAQAKATDKLTISLDVGSHNTKMLVGRLKPSGILIEKALMELTPANSYSDGDVLDAGQLTALLKDMTTRNRIASTDLVFSVESTKFIKREFALPQIPNEDIIGLATYEMMQYLPIDISEYSIAPHIIGEIEEDGAKKIRVSVCAVPKSIIQTYQKLFTGIGLNPLSMEIHSNSIEKLIQFHEKSSPNSVYANKSVVFIDMGHSFFNVSFYEKGLYQFNQVIEAGGRDLDSIISKALNINEKKAEKVKREIFRKISVEDLESKYANAASDYHPGSVKVKLLIDLLSAITQWVVQINGVISYMKRSKEKSIDRIYIYGGASQISGLSSFLEKSLGIKTTVPKSLCRFTCARDIDKQIAVADYGNALGAFLRA
ncbi:MAG: pilus assembly protein PilM [Clostridiales bacterium]|jgi:type IV pilus assembly protein PilM|nr:pilus assembly protein PilM [Clostridiales bacterium]